MQNLRNIIFMNTNQKDGMIYMYMYVSMVAITSPNRHDAQTV